MKLVPMKKIVVATAVAGLLGGYSATVSQAITATDAVGSAVQTVDTAEALIVLTGDPLSTAKNVDRGNGKRVNFQGAATKSYRSKLSAQRNDLRQWMKVNTPKAQITSTFDIALNAVSVKLNGTALSTFLKSSLVKSAQYQGVYRPLGEPVSDPDLALVNAVQSWGGGGAAGAGTGVKVAVIDSGIDQNHPCFDDAGDSDGTRNFTNNKVIVAKVFNNHAKVAGLTAEAVGEHGTHVAGTIACDYGTVATVDGVTIPHHISGVAPAALLGNYNVFPGPVENARSEDILNALEAAYTDGMHVANMSLGGGANGVQDLLTHAVDNLDLGGMVIAISAGNSGPGFSTVGSPGSAARGLTAGASSVAHTVSSSITTSQGSAVSAAGEFGTIVDGPAGILDVIEGKGPVGVDELANVSVACTSLTSGTGVAVISRGDCDFTTKIRNAEVAGYSAVIVINRLPGTLVMATNGDVSQPTIPAVAIGLEDASIVLNADGENVDFNAPAYVNPFGVANVMADFSSEGPTDVDRRIKPDLVAPGENVLSSIPGGKFAFYSGTSMASPHLAGAAAVVLSQHPAWTPWQVRSAITNTANAGALSPYHEGAFADDPNLVGAGLLDVAAAVDAKIFVDSVSVSFGTIPSGSGQRASRTVAVQNVSSSAVTARVVGTHGGVVFTVAGTLAGNSTNPLIITAQSAKGTVRGHSWATIEFVNSSNAVVAHMRVYVLIS